MSYPQYLIESNFIFPQLFTTVNDTISKIVSGGTYSNGNLILNYVDGTNLVISGFSGGTSSGGSGTTLTGGTFNSTTGVLILKNSNGSQVLINGFPTSASTVFQNNITVSLSGGKTLGRFTNGQVIPSANLTSEQVMNLIAIEFLAPAFSNFYINGQNQKLESGDSIPSGSKNYLWSTTNSSNISGNSITIRNQTANTTLGNNLANDGTEVINLVSPITLNGVTNQTFRIIATDTQNTSFQRDFTISSLYKIFYGTSTSAPLDSASVRNLGTNRFTNDGNTFSLNTGNVNRIFTVAMPLSNNLVSVFDVTASNADVTSQYILSTFTVNDFAGNPVSYKVYTMTQAVPYFSTHNHSITIS